MVKGGMAAECAQVCACRCVLAGVCLQMCARRCVLVGVWCGSPSRPSLAFPCQSCPHGCLVSCWRCTSGGGGGGGVDEFSTPPGAVFVRRRVPCGTVCRVVAETSTRLSSRQPRDCCDRCCKTWAGCWTRLAQPLRCVSASSSTSAARSHRSRLSSSGLLWGATLCRGGCTSRRQHTTGPAVAATAVTVATATRLTPVPRNCPSLKR
jgi:hypothetical protein